MDSAPFERPARECWSATRTRPKARKIGALDMPWLGTSRAERDEAADDDLSTASEIAELLKDFGGRQEARTPDLRVANAKRK